MKNITDSERYKKVRIAGILGITGNVFLMLIKGFSGFMFGSQAMIADFFNSTGDIFSSLMTFIGNKIASKPYDEDHNLGHGKAEYIFSMLISVAMMETSLIVIKKSVDIFFTKSEYTFSPWLFAVCITTAVVKLGLYIYTNALGKKMKNLLISANSKDHRNDCFITLINLASVVCARYGIYKVDAVAGIVISVWIFCQGVIIFKQSFDILMDKSMDDKTKEKVIEIVNKYDQIKKYTHFNSTPVGYKYQISLSIFVDGRLSTAESHNIANKLEKEIIDNVEEIYLAVIHVNPL